MFPKISSLLLTLFILPCLYAQDAYKVQKWGKISKEETAMQTYKPDAEAPAVILQDVGAINFYNNDRIKIVYTQHRRIKVFDKSALDEGNIIIPYYSKKGFEKFNNLEVQVFTPDGKKQKVSKKTFKDEQLNEYWSAKKIFIPNVQKGSIIEYRFALSTESFYELRDWEFQDELPIRLSQFKVSIPPYYDYSSISRLPKPAIHDEKYEEMSDFGGAGAKNGCRKIIIQDIPALKEEPYCNTLENYKGLLRFQLQGYKYPGQPYKKVTSTWEKLATEMYEHNSFGKQISKEGRYDKIWAACKGQIKEGQDPKEKAEVIRSFVAENIKFNGAFRKFIKAKTINDAYEAKEGGTSAINLAVVALLRKAGLDAWPILISTQNHGAYIVEYPLLDQFNCVAAWVNNSGGFIVDATDVANGTGIARKSMYNKKGWVVNPNHPTWVDLNAPISKQVILADVVLSEDGSAKATVNSQLTNHFAIVLRKDFRKSTDSEVLEKLFIEATAPDEIGEIELEEKNESTKPLKANFTANFDALGESMDDLLFFQPVFAFDYTDNPFSALTRNFPVNFSHKMSYQFIGKYTLPEGYVVEERPENISLSLSNNGGRFMMTTTVLDDGKLQVVARFSLNQLDFYPDEYKGLREFFDLMAAKLNKQIVLKKA